MSSRAAIEPGSNLSRIPPAARLIPGLTWRCPERKQPQSVKLDSRYWTPALDDIHARRSPRIPDLAETLFPKAVVASRHWKLSATVMTDLIVLAASFAAVSTLRVHATAMARPAPFSTAALSLLYAAMVTLLAHSEGLYREDMVRCGSSESIIAGKAIAWATLLVGTACEFVEGGAPVFLVLLFSSPLGYAGILGLRWARYAIAQKQSTTDRGHRNVLIIGADSVGRRVAAALTRDPGAGRSVIGFLDDTMPLKGNIRGRVRDLAQVARMQFVDEVVLTNTNDSFMGRQVIREARRNHLDVRIVPDLFGFSPASEALEHCGSVPTLTVHREIFPQLGLVLKRVMDFTFSGLGLLLLAPVFAVTAVLIKFDSPGPIFYRAPRIGRKGRKFLCYKFRTMVADANDAKEQLRALNEREGPIFKISLDPRITRLGGALRRYSIDELPQLWNVLKGEMSLVGPRPHPVDDCQRYRMPHLRRLDVTPGITGLWQITARRDPSFERNMELDLEYIERWSLWLDLEILLRTAWVVLRGSGT